MANLKITQLVLVITLGSFLICLACPTCPTSPTPPNKPPKLKPPPSTPKPPPTVPKTPVVKPPTVPKPPVVKPPTVPKTPTIPKTPTVPKTPPKKKPQERCPIDTLKLGACVDVLGGLVHIGLGSSSKDACCPVLSGLADLDAGICLCTAIKARVLNLNVIVPIALQVLLDCGKTPPEGFKCPA